MTPLGLRRVMMDYKHWATLGVLGEILPWEDNRVELAEEKDRHGLTTIICGAQYAGVSLLFIAAMFEAPGIGILPILVLEEGFGCSFVSHSTA
jgi:hypothetical protein